MPPRQEDPTLAATQVLSADQLRRVRSVLYLSGVRGTEIDDATQDVQLRLLEQPAASIDNLGAWACVVAARLAVDRHRRASTRLAMVHRLRSSRTVAHDEPDLALAHSVRSAVSQLEPDLRAVIVLRYYADLSVADIARMLDVPEGTIKSRLHRAAAVLRPTLQEAP
ncbi:MAG: RNA polymerase sigma factor [Frankiales bacterium]|nr:RNA polymerase sigma factor [Frankiales bacterium]